MRQARTVRRRVTTVIALVRLAIFAGAFNVVLGRLAGGGLCGVIYFIIGNAGQVFREAAAWLRRRTARRQRSAREGIGAGKPYRHSNSLNEDPYNMRAEELAINDCSLGVEVRRTWSETEMVRSFNGGHIPGTPDGMFESWEGALTCVQVVRVPLVRELDADGMYETLAQTIITKVVKSQQWLHATSVTPGDFIIFCWLPFAVSDAVAVRAHALMEDVRSLDPRFSLRLRVPSEPHSLFPVLFACNHDVKVQRERGHTWSDVATYSGSDQASDEAEDIVWGDLWSLDVEESEVDQEGETRLAQGGVGENAGFGTDKPAAEGDEPQGNEAQGDDGKGTGFVLVDGGLQRNHCVSWDDGG